MAKPIATYLVKVTLRASDLLDAPPPGGDMWPPKPPTNDELASAVVEGIKNREGSAFEVTATSERTDI
jgi:hypothetical protein